jgi:hypothetical protein
VTLGRGHSDHTLFVMWTERGVEITCIFSALEAGPGEARNYED